MSIKLDFLNLIIPLESIRRIERNLDENGAQGLRRGMTEALENPLQWISESAWHDGDLFCFGVRESGELSLLMADLESCGLGRQKVSNGEVYWKDFCAAASGQGIVSHLCDWAAYDAEQDSVALNERSDTALVSPDKCRAIAAYQAKNYGEALRRLRPLAEAGDTTAQRHIATAYANGHGVERDFEQAAIWLLRAGEGFDAAAWEYLAKAYESGMMYEGGRGIPHDPVHAYRWYKKLRDSASGPDRQRVAHIDIDALIAPMLANARSALDTKEYLRAIALYEPLGDAGNHDAQIELATIYGKGLGGMRNAELASTWLIEAAHNKDLNACLMLAVFFETGNLYGYQNKTPIDTDKAYHWYFQAAKLGDEAAGDKAHSIRPKALRSQINQFGIPETQRRIDGGRDFTVLQWELIERGFVSGGMDKWFIFVEAERLLAVRTWSAWLVFDAYFAHHVNGTRLSHFLVPSESNLTDEDLRGLLYELIDYRLLKKRDPKDF